MENRNLKDLFSPGKKVHFIGIGGCGVSAIARVMLALGYSVSGSDIKESANTIRLKELGAKIYIGHEAINIRDAQVIVYTSAAKADNPEMMEAKAMNIPSVPRAQALGYLMSLYAQSIGVAGTHGKTTTSSMISVMLSSAGLDPTYMIGGEVTNLGSNAGYGKSKYFVAEADESDGSIKYLNPNIFVLANLEKDHMDYFSSLEEIIDLFHRCTETLSEHPDHLLVINGEQWGNQLLLKKIDANKVKMTTFGLGENVNVRATNIRYKGNGSTFTVLKDNAIIGEMEISVPGEHNVLNALSAIIVGLHVGLDFLKIKMALKSFTGAKRRFTLVGQSKGIKVYDDYAHHPTEISATINAARNVFPNSRIVCAFQPHRYSRTLCFLNDFAESLALADKVIITSIYGAGEKPNPEINAEMIARKIPAEKVVYIDRKDDIASYLETELKEHDIFFTIGAGDIYAVGKEILNRLKIRKKTEHAAKLVRIA